jgi:nitrite reductase/ring-hydroxylating ferredoxin subunit
MSRRVLVGEAADIGVGEGRVVEADGKTLALFNVDVAFFALDNGCAHRGGPLGEGFLEG